jgi:hypothetical protein
MMKLKMKQRRRQRGATLVLALLVLGLASLLVTGLLWYVNTSVIAHGKEVDRTEARYAADAGLEWFVSELFDSDIDNFKNREGDHLWADEGLGTVNGKTPDVIIEDIQNVSATERTYIVESSCDNVSTRSRVTRAHIAGFMVIGVQTWDIDD